MEFLNEFIVFCQQNGTLGLFILAFAESVVSPILPDIILIPLCLANPQRAIYYSAIATLASVMGGFVGYGIGRKFGSRIITKMVPSTYLTKIRHMVDHYGGWAVFWAAIAPIPYKFVSISAGFLQVRMKLFVLATALGRGKRFLLEGVLIYFFGPKFIKVLHNFAQHKLDFIVVTVAILVAVYLYYRFHKCKPRTPAVDKTESTGDDGPQ